MNAWLALQRTICPSCGTTEADWVDKAGRALDQPKWEPLPFRCHGCAQVALAQKAIPGDQHGVRIVLVPAREQDDDE